MCITKEEESMKVLTDDEVNVRIEDFLGRKTRQFPDLRNLERIVRTS